MLRVSAIALAMLMPCVLSAQTVDFTTLFTAQESATPLESAEPKRGRPQRIGMADFAARLDAIEAENQALRAELMNVTSSPSSVTQASHCGACDSLRCDGGCDGCGGCSSAEDCGWVDQLSESCKEKLSWNLGNGWRIKPFGKLRGDVIYSEAPQTADAIVIFLNPNQPGIPEDQSTVHGKATQLFFALEGPKYGSWQTGGLIALNFLGPQPIRNQSGANIVNAYGEIKNDKWGFRFGRMLDLFGPLDPTTVNYIAQRGAGNIGIFRGAFNVDRYITWNEKAKTTLSARISQQNILDYTVVPAIRGKDAGWPNIEARVGVALGPQCDFGRPFEIGLSGFVGETQAIRDALLDLDFIQLGADSVNQSRGAAIDLQLKGARFGFRGEGWWGKAAGTYFVATLQTANPENDIPLESVGGWGELYYNWSKKTLFHGGYGIDDPLDSRLGFLTTSDVIGQIRFNDVAWVNVFHNLTESFQVGFEFSHRDTKFVNPLFDNSGFVYHFISQLAY